MKTVANITITHEQFNVSLSIDVSDCAGLEDKFDKIMEILRENNILAWGGILTSIYFWEEKESCTE